MNEYEIKKLRKQLQRKQEQLKEEKEDHQHTQERLVQIQAERDRFYQELVLNRQTLEKVETLMAQKMKEIKSKLEQENSDSLHELQALRDRLSEEGGLKERLGEEIKNKDSVISQLSLRLKEMSRKYKDPSLLVNVKEVSEQVAVTNQAFYKLTQKYNKSCSDLENILAENKILRKLHGVPDNFGFDLQEIKIAEKQQLADYKAQCRKLEEEIEELEEERTQLRYRLRQYNTLFSNKGERYKDMTPTQLELLDRYALNLKEGRVELPEIDKTKKQMEREIIKLKGQIQILQSKASPQAFVKPQDNGQKLSVEALRRLEQQMTKLIDPLREDVKKMGQEGWTRPPGPIQVIEGPNYRPPMPLPIAHNDWSQIKEGFSYLYNSKIHIDLKDVEDEGVLNTIKAKYEIAALQLQNIESLKLLKEKEGVEAKLSKQLQDLKEKYQKCLKIQDQLFLKHFTEREEANQKCKKLEIEKNNLLSEKEQTDTSLSIMKTSFNALTLKTDIEKRCSDLTSRLAIAEAELLKISRKYEVLNDEHTMLRGSYSGLEGRSAAVEYSLKQKLGKAKRNQKQLSFFLRKLLQESRASVSGEVHNRVVAKLQSLSDQTLNNSIKETELRLKINQLQNIERQINLKEDVIQTLRQDNFDINLELEIVKSRLQNSDPDYKAFQNVFRRLIAFINHNNVSIMSYFKKFDRDNSGELSKNEFASAIRALGFQMTNNEFELLFNQFDLDGSQSITYREFLRKMRRSGVFTHNKEEQALYRLFKAIKQANITIRKAFQIIDVDGNNKVSKVEMETAFRTIGIQISHSTIDYIFKICDNDLSGDISCSQFQKLFEDIVKESVIEEKEVFGTELDWKLTFVLKVQECAEKYYKGGLKEVFKALDTDGSSSLSYSELTEFFRKAGIELDKDNSIELFSFLDRHRDGKVEYFQLLKVLQEARQEKTRIDRLKHIRTRVQELRKQNQSQVDKEGDRSVIAEEKAMSIKLLSLESKHTSVLKKNEKMIKSLASNEQQLIATKQELEEEQKNVQQIRTEYYRQKQLTIQLEEKLKNRISQAESKKLTDEARQREVELLKAVNDSELYKKLYEDLSTKNRFDQMRMVKIESEVEKYYQIVKDLQSLSDINAELGKKVYELEISKRNEEIINKKYDEIVQEIRLTQEQTSRLEDQGMDKEREIIKNHYFFQEKCKLMQMSIDALQEKILPTLNPQKVNEILFKIRDISQSKTQLEKENKQIRELIYNLQVRNDYLENQKIMVEELQSKLKRTYTDEASLTIIDLTKKLTDYRMSQLKAKREASLLREKEDYYLRVSNAQTENVKEIEAELANWETKYNEREEFWRKRLSEQMKLMESLQQEASKSKEEQRNAELFFKQQKARDKNIEEKFEALPEEKKLKISSLVRKSKDGSNQNAIFELKGRIQQLENELVEKEKEIYQLKTSFKQLVPEAKLTDFSGQMSASTTNFLMQTELTTSQLRNNARRFINNQKDQEHYYRQEAQKISLAAQQSIDTLQRMIDDKNDQLKRKEHLIQSLRKQFMKVKEEDTRMIQVLNEEIRELKTKAGTSSINDLMNKPTRQNFYGSRTEEGNDLRRQLQKKEEEMRILQDKYDKLYISKEKKGRQRDVSSQQLLQRKLEEVQCEREAEKRKFNQKEDGLKTKIANLEKLSKEKDIKLSKLQKTLIDLKNLAVNEGSKIDNGEAEELMKEAIESMTKGKTPNDSRMEIAMQKGMQELRVLNKRVRQVEQENKRLREDKLSKTHFKK